jgi:hypothetical protein
MSKTLHSVKLFGYASVDLDKITYSNGDVVYDVTSGTLRLMDGATQGGLKIASQPFVTSALNTALSSYVSSSSLTATLSSYATNSSVTSQINAINSSLTGYVTSSSLTTTLSSYATTASLSSYATTASLSIYATTSSLSTLAPKASPTFTGTATFSGDVNAGNIKNLVVNDLGGGGALTVGSQIQIGNSTNAGAGVLIKNVVTNTLGGEFSSTLEQGSKIQMDSGNVSLSSYTYNSISGSSGLESRLVVEVDNSYLNNVVRIGTRIINTGVESPINTFQGVTISQYGDIATPGSITTASAIVGGVSIKSFAIAMAAAMA